MALSPVTGIRSGAGFRSCTLFALDSNGLPLGNSASVPYQGVKLSGGKVFTFTDPEPRKIFHTGDDSIIISDLLPPLEGVSAELHAGKLNDIVDALITGQLAFSAGEMALFGGGTDKRGFETQVGLIAFQHAPDGDVDNGTAGVGGWNGVIFPKCVLFQRETGFNDQPADRVYSVMPMIVSKHLWGPQFSTAVEGFTRAQYIRTYGRGRPVVMSWMSAASPGTSVFTFPLDKPAVSVNKIKVYVDGVEKTLTSDYTTTVAAVTLVSPVISKNVTVLYEY